MKAAALHSLGAVLMLMALAGQALAVPQAREPAA